MSTPIICPKRYSAQTKLLPRKVLSSEQEAALSDLCDYVNELARNGLDGSELTESEKFYLSREALLRALEVDKYRTADARGQSDHFNKPYLIWADRIKRMLLWRRAHHSLCSCLSATSLISYSRRRYCRRYRNRARDWKRIDLRLGSAGSSDLVSLDCSRIYTSHMILGTSV